MHYDPDNPSKLDFPPGMTLAQIESEAIRKVLAETGGNRSQTARMLGISIRTLQRRLLALGINEPLRQTG